MTAICEKTIIKKLLFIPLFIGMLSSYISTTHGSFNETHGSFTNTENDDSFTDYPQRPQRSLMQKINVYHIYLILEICATIIEGFNIKDMGSTSAESIKKAAFASVAMHGIKTTTHLLAFLLTTTKEHVVAQKIIVDAYFLLSRDMRKFEHSKQLATFYKQHKNTSRRVKGKRGLQAGILLLSALIKIALYGSLAAVESQKISSLQASLELQKISPLQTSLASMIMNGGVIICGIIDFFRKQARYNAELSEQFEIWLSEQKAEEEEEDEEDEESKEDDEDNEIVKKRKKPVKKRKSKKEEVVVEEEDNADEDESEEKDEPAVVVASKKKPIQKRQKQVSSKPKVE